MRLSVEKVASRPKSHCEIRNDRILMRIFFLVFGRPKAEKQLYKEFFNAQARFLSLAHGHVRLLAISLLACAKATHRQP